MRKLVLAAVIGTSLLSSAIASAKSDSVFDSKDTWDLTAMYGAGRQVAAESETVSVFESTNAWDLAAMYGASYAEAVDFMRPVALVATTGDVRTLGIGQPKAENHEFQNYIAEPIPGGP